MSVPRSWVLGVLGAMLDDEMLHRLAQDPEFDTRPTMPAPVSWELADTIPAPPPTPTLPPEAL